MEKVDTSFCSTLNYECLCIVHKFYVQNNAPKETIQEVLKYKAIAYEDEDLRRLEKSY